MKRRTTFLAAITVLGLGAAALSGQIDETYWRIRDGVLGAPAAPAFHVPPSITGPQRVIYHVVEKGSWRNRDGELIRLVSVVNNHIRAVEPDDVAIEVLMHGNGIDILKRARGSRELASRVDDLKRRGVQFTICANTLQSYGIPLADLYGARESDLVPSAVARIVQLQQQGYAYIRF